MVALGIATVVALILSFIITKGKFGDAAEDGRRLLELIGPLCILPQLLAALGSVFSSAGVGQVIADGISAVIPQGNILLGVIAYCVGMALFTMIMGNAFAAFAVITLALAFPSLFLRG